MNTLKSFVDSERVGMVLALVLLAGSAAWAQTSVSAEPPLETKAFEPNGNILLDLGEGIFFRKTDGTIDGTRLIRDGGNAIRFLYGGNSLVFTSKENFKFMVRNSDERPVFSVHPTGDAFFLNPGNLGVGVSAPSEKLEVQGNIKLSGNIVSDGDICIGSGC